MSETLFTDEEPEVSTALQTVPNDRAQFTSLVLQAASDPNFDEGKMRAMFDMQRDWDAMEARKAYALAMTAAQSEMRAVVRERENKQQGSMYAALEDIHRGIKPKWLEHGFTLSYGSAESPLKDHYRVTCECLHRDGHSTHHFLDAPADAAGIKGNPNKTPVQAVISTGTYLRRALAVMIFDITITGADQDGQRPLDNTLLSDEQCLTIEAYMSEHELAPQPFLKFMQVERLGDIYARDFDECMTRLRNKVAEKKNARR